MIDLTPLDVRKKRGDFRRILRGYDPEEVDTFMDLVAERFEELVRENLALSEKSIRLEGQLEALEGREKAVQEALVSAQKLREDVKDQSQRDAEVLKGQALREADLIKAEADAEIQRRIPIMKDGGFVVMPDHLITPGVSLENYKYYLNQIRKLRL